MSRCVSVSCLAREYYFQILVLFRLCAFPCTLPDLGEQDQKNTLITRTLTTKGNL